MTEDQSSQTPERPPDEPIGQPEHVDEPTEGEHLQSPGEGYPAADTDPHGGDVPSAEEPAGIGPTASDEEGEESVTQSPGTPPDPDNG